MSDAASLPDRPDPRRATDAERDEVAARLKSALGAGALTLDEIELRLDAVYEARTRTELDAITADLPAPAPAPVALPRFPALHASAFRAHLTVYVLVIGFLVGIWAMTDPGAPFWPFFPAGGWGIGLGAHFVAVNEHERRKARRRAARAARRTENRAVEPPAPPAVGSAPGRRYVAALFVDVVGSTELNESMGDSAWARERDRLRALCGGLFAEEGGSEVNAAGDGFLARFDHPAAAVRAAINIQKALATQRDDRFTPSVRIGIHSGDVIDEGDDIVGSVINLASRVNGAADADEILVTEHVADHLDASIDTEDRGIHTLRGISRPRHLVSVNWR